MERYSLIVITDETAPIRRFDVRKDRLHQGLRIAALFACLFLVGGVDYVRVRIDHGALAELRNENAAQRAQIEDFRSTIEDVESNLAGLRDFERKVRIIANLPGAAGTGGDDVVAVGTSDAGDLDLIAAEGASDAGPAAAVARASVAPADSASTESPDAAKAAEPIPAEPSVGDEVSALERDARRLGAVAKAREQSLADLLHRLEEKRHRLVSTPAIWPTKGWLTSRFGNRISPFTGSRQFHAGIDIAGARGTDVIAPAQGRVTFAGKRGGLGRTLTIDHGFGIRTVYGHVDEFHAKTGQNVDRGQIIASLGNSGRSTGPHLHYVVEVNGKAVNPLDYIFD
jgi:murein DD-endopeptidase MepM/ murein hydrolase activator NlpD